MVPDVVILHTKDSFDTLTYCVRSICEYVDFRRLWVVGYKPDHLQADHIPASDDHFIPQVNATNKLWLACTHNDIAENFILFHDDIFLTRPYKPVLYHRDLLQEKYERVSPDYRADCMARTLKYLDRFGIKEPLNYELHYPMPMVKSEIKQTLEAVNWKHGIAYYSLYANQTESFEKQSQPDCKFRPRADLITLEREAPDMPVFSTHPVHENEDYRSFYERLYPKRSRYELPQTRLQQKTGANLPEHASKRKKAAPPAATDL